MTYKVVAAFKDLQDNDHIYREGDVFPHEDAAKPKADRLKELIGKNNKLRKPLIEEVKEEEVVEPKGETEDAKAEETDEKDPKKAEKAGK